MGLTQAQLLMLQKELFQWFKVAHELVDSKDAKAKQNEPVNMAVEKAKAELIAKRIRRAREQGKKLTLEQAFGGL
jgi:hypothetical protein